MEKRGSAAGLPVELEEGDEALDAGEFELVAFEVVSEDEVVFEAVLAPAFGADENGPADARFDAEVLDEAEELEDLGDKFRVLADRRPRGRRHSNGSGAGGQRPKA